LERPTQAKTDPAVCGESIVELQELESLAVQELAKHGLHEWSFAIANTKRRLGACKYQLKRIEVAEYHARTSSVESILDTLRHEIAHALAGPAAGHGPVWKAIAFRLGATPRACAKPGEVEQKPGDWQATCVACKKTYHRYRRPRVLSGYRCRCSAHSPLAFAFAGDPLRWPEPPATLQAAANWEAKCNGCGSVHLRLRKPKGGRWRCLCPQKCEITWQPRTATGS